MRADFELPKTTQYTIQEKRSERIYPVDPADSTTFEEGLSRLPIPSSLKGVVSWTDALVDKIACLVEEHDIVCGYFASYDIYLFENRKIRRGSAL
jgi:hypothetical protein